MKQLYTPLEKMKGLCKYCIGDCLRLELVEFEGTNKCDGFEPASKDWHEKYREDFKRGEF